MKCSAQCLVFHCGGDGDDDDDMRMIFYSLWILELCWKLTETMDTLLCDVSHRATCVTALSPFEVGGDEAESLWSPQTGVFQTFCKDCCQ